VAADETGSGYTTQRLGGRSQTFRKRADLDILFAAIDIEQGAVLKAWLIPSAEFAEVVGKPDAEAASALSHR
jgi:hypothetical protein